VDDAIGALDRAEVALDRALGGGRQFAEAPRSAREREEAKDKSAAKPSLPAQPAPANPAPTTAAGHGPPAAPAAPADDRAEAGGELASTPPCVAACRALASMERAVEHLCGLAGPGDARCESARSRAKSAAERVRAGCPTCPRE
jgi:hypothetical protein